MELGELGFRVVGSWGRDDHLKSKIRFRLTAMSDIRVLYAFDVDGEPKYIGVCEAPNTTLKDRMKRYQSMAGAGQNRRVAGEIRAALLRGKTVGIHALKPELRCEYRGLGADLVKGLENPLVESFKPEWNTRK